MNRITRTTAAAASSLALALCLGGCAQNPLKEKSPSDILEHAAEYSTQHTFTPIHLEQTTSFSTYQLCFDSVGWTEVYLPPALNNEAVNYYIKGRFENAGDDVYRLSDSTEAVITINGEYRLKGTVAVIDYGVVRDDPQVHPGETVDFIIRTPLPKAMRDSFENAVVTFTLYSAGTKNGIYTTHSSNVMAEFTLGATNEGCL